MVADHKRKWVLLTAVAGSLPAELLRGLLEAQNIQVMLSQEGAGRAYGLTVGPLGEVEILVPEDQYREAEAIIQAYYRDAYEDHANPD